MKLLNQIKIVLGFIGVTGGVQAQIQEQRFQVVSQEELLNALQNNKLELLLLKKGILIQKPSADSTVCEKCSNGGGN